MKQPPSLDQLPLEMQEFARSFIRAAFDVAILSGGKVSTDEAYIGEVANVVFPTLKMFEKVYHERSSCEQKWAVMNEALRQGMKT